MCALHVSFPCSIPVFPYVAAFCSCLRLALTPCCLFPINYGSPNGRYNILFLGILYRFVVSALLQCQTWARSSRPIRLRDVHQPATRPQSRLSRAVMPPTVSACSLAEANLFSRMRPRAAMGQCDRTVRMPAPCPSRVRAAHPTIARFGPRAKFPTLLH